MGLSIFISSSSSDEITQNTSCPAIRLHITMMIWSLSRQYCGITICTKDRKHYFGEIGRDDSSNHPIIKLNELWQYCDQEIQRLSIRNTVDIHERIVMPNHIHILLIISGYPIVGVDHQSTLNNKSSISGDLPNRPYDGPSLSSIVKLLKWNITKYAQTNDIVFGRQRSFHDHIIRNEDEYNRIKYYIQTNPQNRDNDSLQ